MEAIAVEVWFNPTKPREIYAGDNQFFEGLVNRLLEINREDNPFPALCVVRALVMASALDFFIGPKLASYIVEHGESMSDEDLQEVQQAHYGCERRDVAQLRKWIRHVADHHDTTTANRLRLPIERQLEFWPDDEESDTVRLHAISGSGLTTK